MDTRKTFAGAVALALFPAAAIAQETQTYSYDAHGRLMGVTRTASSENQTTTYVLDKADNRSSRAVTTSSMALTAPSEEEAAEVLATRPEAEATDPDHAASLPDISQ